MKTKSFHATIVALLLATLAPAQSPAVPVDASALHQQSVESVKQKKFQDAVDFAERATKVDAAKPEYFSQLGIALSQRMNEVNFMQMAALSGKMKKAFEKSVALDANHVPGLIGLARFYANAPEIAGGSLEKAAEFAARLQKLDPFMGEMELGLVAEKNEQPDAALAHYEAAAKANPKSTSAPFAAGRMLTQLGQKAEARIRYETVLTLNPEHEAAKKALAGLDAAAAK